MIIIDIIMKMIIITNDATTTSKLDVVDCRFCGWHQAPMLASSSLGYRPSIDGLFFIVSVYLML